MKGVGFAFPSFHLPQIVLELASEPVSHQAHNLKSWVRLPSEPLLYKRLFMETEKCISCGVDTKIPCNLHIDYRHYYVEGAGQLCTECWENIYTTD